MRFYIFNLPNKMKVFQSSTACFSFLDLSALSAKWYQIWCNLDIVGLELVGEHAVFHKALSSNAICWYIVDDDNLFDNKLLSTDAIAQSQNQLNNRCQIRVFVVYVFDIKIIQTFIWSIITNENVSFSCAFGCKKLSELVNKLMILITLSEKDEARMPSEITWRSKFNIWFLFISRKLWAREFGRMQVLILSIKEFNGHLSNNLSTAEIRTFINCTLNSLTPTKEIISFFLEFDNDSSGAKPI